MTGETRFASWLQIEDVANAKVSLMPEMTAVLSPSEVRHLVAYLKTLR